MVLGVYSKLDIAREYIDQAIDSFLAQSNYFCAIHLAAAAEELFGAHLPVSQRISDIAERAEKAITFKLEPAMSDRDAHRDAHNSVTEWKNEVKHMKDGTSHTLAIDPVFAASFHIEHALINFYKLGLQKSAAIWRFEDHQNRR